MSEIIEVPDYLRTKSNEPGSQKMLAWIATNQKRLRKAFPPGERAFCRIIDKLKSKLGDQWKLRLCYNRQKHFWVTPEIVFFGDFYFSNLRLLIEIDGASHAGRAAKEKDEWRTKLISSWKVRTHRLHNDEVVHGDFRQIEGWFVDRARECMPHGIANKLLRRYGDVVRSQPDLYKAEGVLRTWNHPERHGAR